MKAILSTLCLYSSIILFSQNGKELIRVTDMTRIKPISGIVLSADGSKAAFTVAVTEPDAENKNEYKTMTQVWMIATDGSSAPRQLTSKESASQPAWSPNGKQLAFVRNADDKPQIFLLSLDGGEAIQLTHFRYGASTPKWSPDGMQIVFSSSIDFNDLLKDSILNAGNSRPKWPFEKPSFNKNEQLGIPVANGDPDGSMEEIRSWLNNNATDKRVKVLDKLNFQNEMDVSAEINFNHYFIMDAVPGAKPVEITKGFYDFDAIEFMPDGKQLIVSGDVDSLQHPDRSLENQIFICNTDGSHFRKLLGTEGKSYFSQKVSPSGKWLAFQYNDVASVTNPVLAIMPLAGSAKDMFIIPFDRNRGNITWSRDEKYIYFTAQSNGGTPLYRVALNTRQVEQLTSYDSGIMSYGLVNNKLVFVKAEVANPYEIYIADANAKNAKIASNFNYEWARKKQLSFPEKKTFVNNAGMTVEYWVMKPANYEAGKKYPLLLEIHGGPSAMWGPGESTMWHEFQYFCSKGYGVVYCNPRGSGGYGLDFLRANIRDWGEGPTHDVLTALDKTITGGWADTSRLLVTGGSYGGYLVAWIIAHDQRFAAACSQRGVYDLATFFGEGNAWLLVPEYFGGYPWQDSTKKILQHESPITYVENIHTPYIIFHGENDRRTGFVGGEMLFRSLKVLQRPVEYVRHPNATHEITRSGSNRQRIDQMLRTYEFFERWLKRKKPVE